jgi:hypothetical protein
VVIEELDAPADRVAQRSMTVRCIATPRGQQFETVLQASQHRRRGQELDARRGQLDRKRQAVEPIADLRHRNELELPRLKVLPHRVRPLEEHADCSRARERSEHELLFPGDPQPHAARHGDLQRRALGDDCREQGRGLDDLLEVVDHEQQPAILEVGDEMLREVALEVE